jgi:hypothetical protein
VRQRHAMCLPRAAGSPGQVPPRRLRGPRIRSRTQEPSARVQAASALGAAITIIGSVKANATARRFMVPLPSQQRRIPNWRWRWWASDAGERSRGVISDWRAPPQPRSGCGGGLGCHRHDHAPQLASTSCARPSRKLLQRRRTIVPANGQNKSTEMPLCAGRLIAPEGSGIGSYQ